PQPQVTEDGIEGQVLRVDRFGNLITNIDRKTVDRVMNHPSLEMRVGPHVIAKFVSTYSDAAPGEICALFGSTDHLEIASNGARASEKLELGRGARVQISRRA